MKIVNETTKINKKNSTARDAHIQMMLMIFVLAVVSFAGGYFVAMAEVAAAVLENKKEN